MSRPPRRLTDRIIDRGMWLTILGLGAVMATVTLVALDLGLAGGALGRSGDLDDARTMAFTTLVLAQLFNCLNARSERASAFAHLFSNRWLWAAIALSAVLQVLVVQVPLMNDAFGTTAIGPREWVICIALASVVLWIEEGRKLLRRARRARGTSRASALQD